VTPLSKKKEYVALLPTMSVLRFILLRSIINNQSILEGLIRAIGSYLNIERWQEYTFIHWGWLKGKPKRM